MKRLLRILYTIRGLILAGTLMTAAIGSYLDRGTAPSGAKVTGHPSSHVQVMDSSQILPPWRIGDPCPPVSTPAPAPLCWSAPGAATVVPTQSVCTPSLLLVAPDIACDDR